MTLETILLQLYEIIQVGTVLGNPRQFHHKCSRQILIDSLDFLCKLMLYKLEEQSFSAYLCTMFIPLKVVVILVIASIYPG